MGIISLFQFQEDSIFIHVNQKAFDDMINEASMWSEKETGGLMFGRISRFETHIKIEILKTHIPTDDNCVRKRTYFEIDPVYAKSLLNSEQLLYLGNWHKHLGYGGPSLGDHRQIEDFFNNNPHLDTIVTFILDFYTNQEYNPIIEVYSRWDTRSEEDHQIFQTYNVPEENISFSLEEEVPSTRRKGISREKLDNIKRELVSVNDGKFSIQDIHELEGQTVNEKIISFPYHYTLESDGKIETLDLLILLSFPPEFPEGKIYIDISSKDMSKDITFDTHPADTLNDEELIEPFLILLKAKLEDDVPILLQKPLWKVIRDHRI